MKSFPLRSDETSHEPLWVKEINDDSDSLSFDKIDSLSELFESNEKPKIGTSYKREEAVAQTYGLFHFNL